LQDPGKDSGRQPAFSFLRQDTKAKIGAKNKRFRAVLDLDHLLKILEI